MKVPKIIYQFWTGNNPITENRVKGIQSMKNINVQSILLYASDINRYILSDQPLHPIYQYLSENHKSDYLRCYFMHHFGGGYADIKTYSKDNNWETCFDYINNHNEIDVIGQKELTNGVIWPEYKNPKILNKLVANGYFIIRPYSAFTTEWWKRVNAKLDKRFEDVRKHPAEAPRDGGHKIVKTSKYPLRWAELQGEIFHKLCFDMRNTSAVCSILKTGRTFEPYL